MDFTAPDGFCVLEPGSSPDVELGWFDKSAVFLNVWDKRLAFEHLLLICLVVFSFKHVTRR